MTNSDTLLQHALHLHQAGQLLEAREVYAQILDASPAHAKALNLLGATYVQRGEYQNGLPFIEHALALKTDFPEAYNNLGIALKGLNRREEVVARYRQAVALKPDYALAHFNLGIALAELRRHEEAVACYQKAVAIKPDYADAHNNLGIALKQLGRHEEAIACYQRVLAIKPNHADAYNNLGNTLLELKRHEEAIACYQQAVSIKPGYADAYNHLGNTLAELKLHAEAIACYQKALAIKPDYPDACIGLGIALSDAQRHEEAAACYRKALALKPDYAFAPGMHFYSKAHCCDWNEYGGILQRLLDGISAGETASTPFSLLAIPSTPAQQKQCAEIFVREKHPEMPVAHGTVRYSHGKIRLGYFSSDFYNHATAYLMAELLEQHDRNRFEVIGFSFGAPADDSMRQRVSAAFDRFIDVHHQTDRDIATLARRLEIDIAIDLKGFTADSRTGIFAMHPAPIQVNYLGYPGTMGAPYIDYLIADPTLIPAGYRQHYSEKIAYLPDTYQVNDSHRRISDRRFTRNEAGLPDEGFVFCCFNNNYKITPAIFDIWMQLLKRVEGSVLWLFEGNAHAGKNLRNEAIRRGVAPERLVFAPRMELPEHLARHQLADLFLDTFFCNAHTTASDALWAGLPVLTCLGETFAGRVAASLLNAAGLPELVTSSHDEYKNLALELASDPEKLASIRRKLAKNRATCPLFNTARFTRHIEDAFIQMQERHQAHLTPDHIYARTSE